MGLGSSPEKAELSTLPERGTFYFALTLGNRKVSSFGTLERWGFLARPGTGDLVLGAGDRAGAVILRGEFSCWRRRAAQTVQVDKEQAPSRTLS